MPGVMPVAVVDEGLGNSSYLLDLGDGTALALDPECDLRALRRTADRLGLRVAYAVETHLHADFVSGVAELAAIEGAQVISPAVGERAFTYRGLADGEPVGVGHLELQAMHTPGHSPEHLSYLLYRDGALSGVFTGGSLMVGTAGRTDLVAPEQTIPLARAQYRSLQKLIQLPDDTPVWPTHGAGSFCSTGAGTDRVTTIGRERAENPLLQLDSEEAFVDAITEQMGSFPDYFRRLPEVNRRGPAVLAAPATLTPLTAAQVRQLVSEGAQVVDTRPTRDYAAGHIHGAISVPLRTVFAVWLGWLADPVSPLIIVRGDDQNPDDIAAEATKVGFDAPAGELAGGMDAWRSDGGAVTQTGYTDAAGLSRMVNHTLIDVRQAAEYAAGHVPGARNLELATLRHAPVPAEEAPVVVMCGHGERASGAASLLERAGYADVTVLEGGPSDWTNTTGIPLTAQA